MTTRYIAIAVLCLPDGRVVLQRRSQDFRRFPGMLGLFGGHIEVGETPEAALRRELQEETSLDAEALMFRQLMHKVLPPDATHAEPVDYTVFTAIIPDAPFDVFEGDGFELYSVTEALARDDITRSTRIALTQLHKESE